LDIFEFLRDLANLWAYKLIMT